MAIVSIDNGVRATINYNDGDNDKKNYVDRYTGINNVDLGIDRYGWPFGTVEGEVDNGENNGRRGYLATRLCFGDDDVSRCDSP